MRRRLGRARGEGEALPAPGARRRVWGTTITLPMESLIRPDFEWESGEDRARDSLPQVIAGALARWYGRALRASKCSSISVALAAAISGSRARIATSALVPAVSGTSAVSSSDVMLTTSVETTRRVATDVLSTNHRGRPAPHPSGVSGSAASDRLPRWSSPEIPYVRRPAARSGYGSSR
jgi:hypothetical protein